VTLHPDDSRFAELLEQMYAELEDAGLEGW